LASDLVKTDISGYRY